MVSLLANPSGNPKRNGPYLKKTNPLEPWGNEYQYHSTAKDKDFEIMSYGKDGKSGGTGEDADVSN